MNQGQLFSDLIGSEVVKAAEIKANDNEDNIKEADEEDNAPRNAKKIKIETSEQRKRSTFYDLFGSQEPRSESDRESSKPRPNEFKDKPMSFMTNFKKDLPFQGKKRVKRSRLDQLPPLDLDTAASAQVSRGVDPNIVAAMFHRQLMLAEEHGLSSHEAVPAPPFAGVAPAARAINSPAPHHVKSMPLPHHHSVHIATRDHQVSHGVSHMSHHAPVVHREHHQVHHVVHEPHQPHHVVPHSAKLIKAPAPVHKFSGYPKPPHGATLEEIFHLKGGKYHAPEPAYHAPEPAYSPPAPAAAYKEPLAEAYHPPVVHATDFHGHPFSMEMVFGLPMQKYYMKKYAHMLPFHGVEDKYHAPVAPVKVPAPPPG